MTASSRRRRFEGMNALYPSGMRSTVNEYDPRWGTISVVRTRSVLNPSGWKETRTERNGPDDGLPGVGNVRQEVVTGWTRGLNGELTLRSDVTAYEYDARDRLALVDGPLPDDTIEYVYHPDGGDDAGRLWQEIVHGPTADLVTSFEGYTWFGEWTRRFGPNGDTTIRRFDGRQRLSQETRPDGSVATFTWDSRGRPDKEFLDGVLVSDRDFDTAGRLVRSTDATGNTIVNEYLEGTDFLLRESHLDAAGTVTYRAEHEPAPDMRGRASTTWFPTEDAPITETYHHDADGRETSRFTPGADFRNVIYDPLGRAIEVSEGYHREYFTNSWTATQTSYDTNDNVTSITRISTDGKQRFTSTWLYDDFGMVMVEDVPEKGHREFRTGSSGMIELAIEPDGSTTRIEMDGAGRVLALVPEASPQLAIFSRYDGFGERPPWVRPADRD